MRVPPAEPGEKLVGFIYDGLGRLIQATRYEPDGQGGVQVAGTEDYYYDGVRRIQEVLDAGQPGEELREYVFGSGYGDELICQIDPAGDPLYYLQDANYNVFALVDQAGDVLLQYVYTPYGEVLITEDLTGGSPPTNRVGHQGLFLYRLDGAAGDPTLLPDTAGLYYNRNRWYSPILGRFVTLDPNESALPIITALAFNADALQAFLASFSPQSHFGDGMNLYLYLGSNPVNGLDGLGLSWGFEHEIDEAIYGLSGERIGAAAAVAAKIGMAFNSTLMDRSDGPFNDDAGLRRCRPRDSHNAWIRLRGAGQRELLATILARIERLRLRSSLAAVG